MLTREELLEAVLKGSASPNGIHKFIGYANCARRQILDDAAKMQEKMLDLRRDAGTVFHMLAAHYHSMLPGYVPVPDESWPRDLLTDVVNEGLRMFAAYRERHPIDAFGQVVGSEVPLEHKLPDGEVLTGKADLIVEADEGQAAAMEERFKLSLAGPGVYLVDHKTHGQKDKNIHYKDAWSLQARAYLASWPAAKGMIFSHIVAHKNMTDDSFVKVFVPPPTEEEVRQLYSYIGYAKTLRAMNRCNLGACNDWGPCRHRISGACTLS